MHRQFNINYIHVRCLPACIDVVYNFWFRIEPSMLFAATAAATTFKITYSQSHFLEFCFHFVFQFIRLRFLYAYRALGGRHLCVMYRLRAVWSCYTNLIPTNSIHMSYISTIVYIEKHEHWLISDLDLFRLIDTICINANATEIFFFLSSRIYSHIQYSRQRSPSVDDVSLSVLYRRTWRYIPNIVKYDGFGLVLIHLRCDLPSLISTTCRWLSTTGHKNNRLWASSIILYGYIRRY